MKTVALWAFFGVLLGFLVLAVFRAAVPAEATIEPWGWVFLVIVIPLPTAIIGTILGVVSFIQAEMHNLRDEIKKLRVALTTIEIRDHSSTHIKAAP